MNFNNILIAYLIEALDYGQTLESLRKSHLEQWLTKDNNSKFIGFYHMLQDDESKEVFLKLLRNNIGVWFAGKRDEYAFYSDKEWDSLLARINNIHFIPDSYELDIIDTFILKSYEYKDVCKVKEGDIVLDIGSYTGNTSLYFSELAGAKGHVYAFEAIPRIYEKLKNNIIKLGIENVHPINKAVLDITDKFQIYDNDCASSIHWGKSSKSIQVDAIRIDDFINYNGIPNVDFIKMDIEGAELKALEGAKDTIEAFNPTLAIAIYHRPEDWTTIPYKILDINSNYRFYMKHSSRYFAETVLFAKPIRNSLSRSPILYADDLEITDSIFHLMQVIHFKRETNIYINLLHRYCEKIENILSIKPIFFKHSSCIFPLSDDKSLHYELIFSGSSLHIGLHFEGCYEQYTYITKEMINADLLDNGFDSNIPYSSGIYHIFPDPFDIEGILRIFTYMVTISVPILKAHKLISDITYLNIAINLNLDEHNNYKQRL